MRGKRDIRSLVIKKKLKKEEGHKVTPIPDWS